MVWLGWRTADLAEQLLSLASLDVHAEVGAAVVLEPRITGQRVVLAPFPHVLGFADQAIAAVGCAKLSAAVGAVWRFDSTHTFSS